MNDLETTDSYIQYYKDIVPENLCNKLINQDFNYQPSTYSTHDSGKVVKDERVRMEDFWIRKDNIFKYRIITIVH